MKESAARLRGGDDFVRLLADRQRLAIAGRLAVGAATISELAADSHMTERAVRRQVPKLVASGLVRADRDRLSLDALVLRDVVATLPRADPISSHLVLGLSAEDAAIAARFFAGNRLVEIPVAPSRRQLVLNILVDEFEPGRYYTESDVRRILRKFHADDAALRRYLVEGGLLARDNRTRTYWRTPGPPPAGPSVD